MRVEKTKEATNTAPEMPVKDELYALEVWLRNLRQGASRMRTQLKAVIAEEKLVVNIIKEWKKLKQ